MPRIARNKAYRIGRSRTGLGLFATKPIKKGARIIRYFGPLLDSRKYEEIVENKYLFALNGRWTIDGSVRRNIARYINHSCKPNAKPITRKGRIVIVAARRIEPDEEITYHYGDEYLQYFIEDAGGCKCAACRRKRLLRRRRARLKGKKKK